MEPGRSHSFIHDSYRISLTAVNLTEVFLTLTEGFPCFFLSCKANAWVKLAKMGHGPHSTTLVVFVLFYELFVCKCVLPPGDNPIAVNKYVNYQFGYRESYQHLTETEDPLWRSHHTSPPLNRTLSKFNP